MAYAYMQIQFSLNCVPEIKDSREYPLELEYSSYMFNYVKKTFGWRLNNYIFDQKSMSYMFNLKLDSIDQIFDVINEFKKHESEFRMVYIMFYWRGSLHRKLYKGKWYEPNDVHMYYKEELFGAINKIVHDEKEQKALKDAIGKLYHADMDALNFLVSLDSDKWLYIAKKKEKKNEN